MCFGGGAIPSAPSEAAQAAGSKAIGDQASAQMGDQLNWAKGQVAGQSGVTTGAQSSLGNLASGAAGANTTGQGLYGQVANTAGQAIGQAQNWGSPLGVSEASANAGAQTQQAMDASRQNNMRQLGSYGVDPSQMKSGALNLNANLQSAGAVGNSMYAAGQNRQLQGIGLTNQALQTGNMAAGMGQGYGQQAIGANTAQVGVGNQSLSTESGALTQPTQWGNLGNQAYSTSGNILSQQFGNQLQSAQMQAQQNQAMMSGIGSMVGSVAGAAMMADGGAIPGRARRYDDGGDVNIPVMDQGTIASTGSNAPAQMPSTGGQSGGGGGGGGDGGLGSIAGKIMGGMMANGGAIAGRYDDGGNVSVPMISIGYISPTGPNSPAQVAGSGGADQNASMDKSLGQIGGAVGKVAGQAVAGRQANAMLPTTNAQIASDPQMQALQTPQFNPNATMADGGQTKKPDFGNPAVAPSQGVPPQVGIPGTWVARDGGQSPAWGGGGGMGFANGGPTPSMGSPPGTFVSQGASDGTGVDDQVPAHVSVGEYVIPADVVHAKGKEFFDKLVQRYHIPAHQQRMQMQHSGIPMRMH